jgi:hypothetical protein
MPNVAIWTYQEAIEMVASHGGRGWAMVDTQGELSYSGISPRHHEYAVRWATLEELFYQARMDRNGRDGAFAVVTTHFPGTEREDIEVG